MEYLLPISRHMYCGLIFQSSAQLCKFQSDLGPVLWLYKIKSLFVGRLLSKDTKVHAWSSDRQFLYLNGRPVEMPKARFHSAALSVTLENLKHSSLWWKSSHPTSMSSSKGCTWIWQVSRGLNDLFKTYSSLTNRASRPVAVLNIIVSQETVDVNVTPDKQKVYVEHESIIVDALEKVDSEHKPRKSNIKAKFVDLSCSLACISIEWDIFPLFLFQFYSWRISNVWFNIWISVQEKFGTPIAIHILHLVWRMVSAISARKILIIQAWRKMEKRMGTRAFKAKISVGLAWQREKYLKGVLSRNQWYCTNRGCKDICFRAIYLLIQ